VASSDSFIPITIGSPASVTAGTQYSIVALNESPAISGWFWYSGKPVTNPPSAYEGGRLYTSPTGMAPWSEGNPFADFEFKTYVTPPPPPVVQPATTAPTGQRAAALKKCKKKSAKKRKKCKKKANLLPV
jgi:hypothetical protein